MQISSPIPDLLHQKLWDGASTLCLHKALQIIWMHMQAWEPPACRIIGRGGGRGQVLVKMGSCLAAAGSRTTGPLLHHNEAPVTKKPLPQLMPMNCLCTNQKVTWLNREDPPSAPRSRIIPLPHSEPAKCMSSRPASLLSLNSGPNFSSSRAHLIGKT